MKNCFERSNAVEANENIGPDARWINANASEVVLSPEPGAEPIRSAGMNISITRSSVAIQSAPAAPHTCDAVVLPERLEIPDGIAAKRAGDKRPRSSLPAGYGRTSTRVEQATQRATDEAIPRGEGAPREGNALSRTMPPSHESSDKLLAAPEEVDTLYQVPGQLGGAPGVWRWVWHGGSRTSSCPYAKSQHEMGCTCDDPPRHRWRFVPDDEFLSYLLEMGVKDLEHMESRANELFESLSERMANTQSSHRLGGKLQDPAHGCGDLGFGNRYIDYRKHRREVLTEIQGLTNAAVGWVTECVRLFNGGTADESSLSSDTPSNQNEVNPLPASYAALVTRDDMGAIDLTSPSFAYDKNCAALDLDINLKNLGPSRGFGADGALALDSAPSAELPHPLPTSPTYSLSSRGTEVMPELDDEPEAHSAGGGKSARHDKCLRPSGGLTRAAAPLPKCFVPRHAP